MGQDLKEFDSTGGDTGKKILSRSNFFSGTAVLYRAINNEMMISTTTEHTSKCVCGLGFGLVTADVGFDHACGFSQNDPILVEKIKMRMRMSFRSELPRIGDGIYRD